MTNKTHRYEHKVFTIFVIVGETWERNEEKKRDKRCIEEKRGKGKKSMIKIEKEEIKKVWKD